MKALGIATALMIGAAPAAAAPPHTLAITLDAGGLSAADGRRGSIDGGWRAEALTATLTSDLADDKIGVVPAGADITLHGSLTASSLRYELRASWPGAPPPVAGTIAFGPAIDRAKLAGILRDQLHRLVRTASEREIDAAIAPPGVGGVALCALLACGLLALPFAIGARRLRDGRRRILALPALRRSAIGGLVLSGAAIALAASGGGGLVAAAGGAAWGAFAAVFIPFAFPPIVGLGRVDHDELARVLVAWFVLAGRQLAIAIAMYAPVGVIAYFALGDESLAVGVPVALLVARATARNALAVAALALDDRLIDAEADARGWPAAVRGYLVGYLHRNGLPVNEPLLARVELDAGGDDLSVYGGGATTSRIVIPTQLLELALAPAGRPHDYAAPRVSTLHWSQWNAGLVMATAADAVLATAEQRQPRELTDYGEAERELFGEPPTTAGVIEPVALDPRTSYRPHDDPMWLDWESGDGYDGTDPGDRDFLFGALVAALATIQRGDDREATLRLVARKRPRKALVIDDLHAALGGARHHLVQYLGWRALRRDDMLTARAYAPELEAASRDMIAATTEPALRQRLVRLANLARPVADVAPVRAPRWQRVVFAGAAVALAGGALFAIVDAVRYRSVYAQRMEGNDHGQTK